MIKEDKGCIFLGALGGGASTLLTTSSVSNSYKDFLILNEIADEDEEKVI